MIKGYRYSDTLKCRINQKPYRLKKKRNKVTSEQPVLIGVDSEYITDNTGKYHFWSYDFANKKHTLTLTQKEADLISLNIPGTRPPKALETLYPWLPTQKYISNSDINHKNLVAIYKRYDKHFFKANEYCNTKWNTVCNKLRMTTNFDAFFYTAWHLPLQAAYILEESRPNRHVFAIDFNSMYPTCMQYPFPDPSCLRHVTYKKYLDKDESLPIGLYRCRLSGNASNFIKKYNPFRSFFAGRYLGVCLDNGIELSLNEFEINLYRRHFSKIYIIDAIISDKSISHPLAKEVRRSYSRRINYESQLNKPLANREKFMMTLMSSCTNRPNLHSRTFKNEQNALDSLKLSYGISPYKDEAYASFKNWLSNRNKISFQHMKDGCIKTITPSLFNGSACFSLSQRIVARSRTILLEQMEKLTSYSTDIEICYCNIDSIHFSIPYSQFDLIKKELDSGTSKNMGSFKVQTITQYGLWLEPGRYWLYSDVINKFSNLGISDGIHPFFESKKYIVSRLFDGLHIPFMVNINMMNTISDIYSSRLDKFTGLIRQYPIKISKDISYINLLSLLLKNRNSTIPLKIKSFLNLKNKFNH